MFKFHFRKSLFLHFVISTLVISVVIWMFGKKMSHDAMASHRKKIVAEINASLNAEQQTFFDLIWDGITDTTDDTRHLLKSQFDKLYSEKQLLTDTLTGYIYPDGHNYYEGLAIVKLDGGLSNSKVNAVITEDGDLLSEVDVASLFAVKPWLEYPWLPSYSFVIDYFKSNPEKSEYISSIIDTDNRKIIVLGSRIEDKKLGFKGAVICQFSTSQIFEDTFKDTHKEDDIFWMVDKNGKIGFTTNRSISNLLNKKLVSHKTIDAILARGLAEESKGELGASSQMSLVVNDVIYLVFFKTVGADFVLIQAIDEQKINQITENALFGYMKLVYLSIIILTISLFVYQFISLNREKELVELESLRRTIGTVSHYLNNPLAGVKGYTELLEKEVTSKKGKEFLEKLNQSIKLLAERVLDIQKIAKAKKIEYDGQVGHNSMYKIEKESD